MGFLAGQSKQTCSGFGGSAGALQCCAAVLQVIGRSSGAPGPAGRPRRRGTGGWRAAAHLVLRLAPQPAMVGWQPRRSATGPRQAGRVPPASSGPLPARSALPYLRNSVSRSRSGGPSAMAAPGGKKTVAGWWALPGAACCADDPGHVERHCLGATGRRHLPRVTARSRGSTCRHARALL